MQNLRWLTMSAVLGLAIAAPTPSHAAFVVNMAQVGVNVVLSGAGTINTAGFVYPGFAITGQPPSVVAPTQALFLGAPGFGPIIDYYSPFTGPGAFGSAAITFATSGSGDRVGLRFDTSEIAVPTGYVSGAALSNTSTYANTTLAALGVSPNSYVWTWGSGDTLDSFTLNITSQPTATPEPVSLALLGTAVAGLALARRRKSN